jgi:hypothetical protein
MGGCCEAFVNDTSASVHTVTRRSRPKLLDMTCHRPGRAQRGCSSGGGGDGCAAGCPAWRCRRVCTTLPPSRVSAAPGTYRLAVSTSRIHGPSVRTVAVRRPRRPSPEPQQMSAELDTAAVSAVRPGAGWTAAVHPGHRRSREQGGDTAAGSQPSMHARRLQQWASGAACRQCQSIQGGLRNRGHLTMPSGRLDGVAAERVSGRLQNWTLRQASAVHRCVRNHRRCPDSRCPPGTLPQAAGVGGYRNRSPARRPLEGCRHRW